ncbi:MAG: hypothetical protein PHW52_01605 [Candidatus Pacebacteria bacterium]|nr:hypothetical protein [Candidatus Paceibacterota bacterium]
MKKILNSIILTVAIIYFLSCFITGSWYFLDWVDLFIHELGHLAFRPFGEMIYFAGGSILQILVPLLCAMYFLRNKDIFSSSIVCLWLGQSFINIAIYLKDAQAMSLFLIGGGTHDWNFMLSRLGLLSQAESFGNLVYSIGVLIIALAGLIGAYSIYTAKEELD